MTLSMFDSRFDAAVKAVLDKYIDSSPFLNTFHVFSPNVQLTRQTERPKAQSNYLESGKTKTEYLNSSFI